MTRYCFIINPAAGGERDASSLVSVIEDVFGRARVAFAVEETNSPGHGAALAREAVQKGFETVVAAGGDGTINEVATALLNTQVALGIIPKGSGEGLARGLGIPLDSRKACETLLKAKEMRIDVGKIDGDYFLNVAGFGLDAQVAYAFGRMRTTGPVPVIVGELLYFYLGFREYFLRHCPSITLSYNGKQSRISPVVLAIANGKQWGSGAVIAPKAVMNDGLLHIAIVEQAGFWRLLRTVPRLFNGTVDQSPYVKTIVTDRLVIDLEKQMPYHVDGEVRFGKTTLTVEILPPTYQP